MRLPYPCFAKWIGLALALAPSTVLANAAARSWRYSDSIAGAWLNGPSPIEIDREELRIECREEKGKPRCAFDASYYARNGAQRAVTTEGGFYGDGHAAIELDGRDVRADVDLAALDPLVRSLAPESGQWDPSYREGFSVTMPAGASGTLRFRGKLSAHYGESGEPYGGFVFPAYAARHPFLSTRALDERRFEFQYRVYPLRAWAGARKVHVEIRWPESWDFARPQLDGAPPFAIQREDGWVRATTDADGASAGTVSLAFRLAGRTVLNGGPFLGVGGQPEPGEVRLRAGYEIAGPYWASYSISAETNAKDRFLVALVAEASLPNILIIIPGLGIGAGPIVGSGPRGPYGGARIQPIFSWPLVSLVVPIDIVAPSFTSGRDVLVTVGILGQLSL